MITGLVILGANALLVSATLAIYGAISHDRGLVGIAVSAGLVGGVFLVYGVSRDEPRLGSLLSYLSILANASTVVLEDLDLLDSRLCVIDGEPMVAVYTKSECPASVNPGLGFASGSPYLSIPVNLFHNVSALEEVTAESVESALRGVLVEELGLLKSIRVEAGGANLFTVFAVGLSDALSEYSKYPVDPFTLLIAVAVARLTGRDVLVVERGSIPDGMRLVLRVGSSERAP
ncbi:MAG: hypothetical protein QXU65_06665 [Sulfolobales archaeon]